MRFDDSGQNEELLLAIDTNYEVTFPTVRYIFMNGKMESIQKLISPVKIKLLHFECFIYPCVTYILCIFKNLSRKCMNIRKINFTTYVRLSVMNSRLFASAESNTK